MTLSLERKIQVGFGVVFAIVLVVGAAALRSTTATVESAGWVAHTLQVRADLEAAFAAVIDAETGVRGYVITGDSAYLLPFDSARATLSPLLARLRTLIADNPVQQQRLDSLQTLLPIRFGQLQRTSDARRTRGPVAAGLAVRSGEGKALTDRIRGLIARLEDEEVRLLARRSATLAARTREARIAVAGGTLLALGLAVVASVLFGRELGRRRAAEQVVRDSERRLFQILDAMPVAVFVLDAAGRPYYANAASREILGQGIVPDATPEQLPEVYQAFRAGTSEPYPPERQPIVRAMTGEPAYVADIEIHRPDRIVPIEVWAAPVTDAAGRVAFAVAAFNDITERQRGQEALRESEERYRLLFERNPLPAWVFDLTTLKFLAVNEAALSSYGYSREEFLTMTIDDIRPPEDVPTVHAAVAPAVAGGSARGGRWRHRKKDGTVIEVEITAHALTYGDRRAELVLAQDITERQRAEQALRESEERFRALAASANDAIVSADSQGRITYVNPGAERLFGYAASELTGQPLTLLMPERFREAHRAGLARYQATGEARVIGKTVELAGRTKDGREFPLELSLANWKRGSELAFTGMLRDITERKRAEDTLRRYAAQLEAANKDLEAFSYSVSHDLRAPLRSIDGFSQALQEDYSARLDQEGKSHLRRVRAAATRMGQLIDDLLHLARVSRAELKSEPVDLAALARSVFAELREREPRRPVEFSCVAQAPVRGDARLLRIVLQNLLGNAWKFTAQRDRAHIELGVIEDNGQPAYFVRDDGAGFDPAYTHKLFAAFQRLHSSSEFEGTGVGLATVARIIHRHGGRVWAEGAVDRGATFYFTL